MKNKIRKNITRLRISAHKLRIETERFNNKLKYIPTEMRTCLICNRRDWRRVSCCNSMPKVQVTPGWPIPKCKNWSISMNMGMKKSLYGKVERSKKQFQWMRQWVPYNV